MDENNDFRSKQLPEIKDFLKARGVKVSGYKKADLVLLAEEAKSQNLPTKDENNYLEVNEKRRTIGTVVLPHPKLISNWSEDLSSLPLIEAFDVNFYLRTECKWTNDRLKSYKNDNSYRLHTNGHVRDVEISKQKNNTFYVKSKCIPEERQNAEPYEIWIIVMTDGTIHSGECTCVAGDGTCKHVAALLFGLQRLCQTLSDRSEVSVTDKAAVWTNPARSSVPAKIDTLDLRSEPIGSTPSKPTTDKYKPSSVNIPAQDIEKEMMRLIKKENLPACAAYILSDSSDSEFDFEPLPKNVLELATEFNKTTLPRDHDTFVKFVLETLPDNYKTEVFNKTVDQSDSDLWYFQRQGRITASILFHCIHFTGRNTDAHLIRQILGLTNNFNLDVPALKHGKKYESKAREAYLNDKKDLHADLSFKSSGLFVDEKIPYLGCSPDGLLECKCCGQGCLEIKCPFKFCKASPAEAAVFDKTNFSIVNGLPVMNQTEKSPYFCQIQCQLAVTKRKWCDFVLYTFKGIHHERIQFNPQFWSQISPKISQFYESYILPKLLQ